MTVGENGFGVELREADDGWRVDHPRRCRRRRGASAPCRDRSEARIFASTVRQHIYWLSAERFRAYYRIGVKDATGVS